jgi:hypothetical protein
MKKLILILAISALPTLLLASCYTDWLETYDAATDQFESNLKYCKFRNVDLWTFACEGFAVADYQDQLNAGETRYRKCVFGY